MLQWAKELKIAIAEENEQKIDRLVKELPTFDSLEQMEEAAYLMQEAHTLLTSEKDRISSVLVKIKKQKEFLNATSTLRSSFDESH